MGGFYSPQIIINKSLSNSRAGYSDKLCSVCTLSLAARSADADQSEALKNGAILIGLEIECFVTQ